MSRNCKKKLKILKRYFFSVQKILCAQNEEMQNVEKFLKRIRQSQNCNETLNDKKE